MLNARHVMQSSHALVTVIVGLPLPIDCVGYATENFEVIILLKEVLRDTSDTSTKHAPGITILTRN